MEGETRGNKEGKKPSMNVGKKGRKNKRREKDETQKNN